MTLDKRRILIFLAFAFGIAWATGLVLALTGGLTNSPALIPGTPFTLAFVLLATAYMWAPALANILTRLITREGRGETWLRPNIRRGWPYWLITWVVPAILVVLGAALFFALMPRYFDPSLSMLRQAPGAAALNPWLIVLANTAVGLLIAPVVNGISTFGEEFGWRAYLLQKLLPLGWRRASLLLGVIWGVWHWPVIAMGYEYGFGYPGFPWLGFITFFVFTVPASIFLSWATLRGRSVWPAVIGHAAINGMAGLPVYFITGQPSPLLGPLAVGVVAALPLVVLGVWLWLRPGGDIMSPPA